jgi:hypothetical protein
MSCDSDIECFQQLFERLDRYEREFEIHHQPDYSIHLLTTVITLILLLILRFLTVCLVAGRWLEGLRRTVQRGEINEPLLLNEIRSNP